MSDRSELHASASVALQFKSEYYKKMDDVASRPALVELYHPGASQLMEWNGHQLNSKEEIAQYLQQLPKTKHTIECMDAQPLPGCENGDSVLVTVNGKVVYDDEHSRDFFQRFVLRKPDANSKTVYVLNDYYRWLSAKR